MPRKEESEPEVVVPPEDMTVRQLRPACVSTTCLSHALLGVQVVQLRAALKKRGLATNGVVTTSQCRPCPCVA